MIYLTNNNYINHIKGIKPVSDRNMLYAFSHVVHIFLYSYIKSYIYIYTLIYDMRADVLGKRRRLIGGRDKKVRGGRYRKSMLNVQFVLLGKVLM